MTVQTRTAAPASIEGAPVIIRPMAAADAGGLAALYESLSAGDRYLRFFSSFAPDEAWFSRAASVSEAGGFGFVAVATGRGAGRGMDSERIVGEASCTPLDNGNVEAAFVVAAGWRGGLGTRLFDEVLASARRRGIANVEIEVLLTNHAMLGILRRHRYGVIARDRACARLVVGTYAGGPVWAPHDTRRRVLVEVPGGWWVDDHATSGDDDAADLQVIVCPGPSPRHPCPVVEGKTCGLARDADVIVVRLRQGRETDAIRAAHWLHHPRPRLVTELTDGDLVGHNSRHR